MSGKKLKIKYKHLFISLVISAAILFFGIMSIDSFSWQVFYNKLCKPITRLMIFICVGLAAGQFIEAKGWTKKLAIFASPVFKFANLGNQCSAAFTAAFFSGVTANGMLLGFYKDGDITKKHLYMSNFLNHFPAYFLHLPTTFFMVIPLTGRAGCIYFGLTFSALILRTSLVALYGFLHPSIKPPVSESVIEGDKKSIKAKDQSFFKSLKDKLPARMINVAVYILPAYIIVYVLNAHGLFGMLNDYLSGVLVTNIVPVESLSVVILSFAAEFTSGFAVAGALMDSGIITIKQVVLSLIIGNIIAFPVRALRHQLPRYIGIFSLKMGTELLFMGQLMRIFSLIVVTLIYYYVF